MPITALREYQLSCALAVELLKDSVMSILFPLQARQKQGKKSARADFNPQNR